jgi:cytochrome c-type biogenesis protein CcmF
VAVPIGIFLLLLTGVGPLLPWRAASFKSIRRNFVLPVAMLSGSRRSSASRSACGPGKTARSTRATSTRWLRSRCARGADGHPQRVPARSRRHLRQTGKNLFAATWLLTRRNTRRYGGYIIHIGVVIVVIGLAGSAFNRNTESELALHDKMSIGPYTLECVGFTQDSNLNYNSEYALLDVYKDGKKQFQMAPEKRIYLITGQPQTMVAIHSVPSWDLYVVYEGTIPTPAAHHQGHSSIRWWAGSGRGW